MPAEVGRLISIKGLREAMGTVLYKAERPVELGDEEMSKKRNSGETGRDCPDA